MPVKESETISAAIFREFLLRPVALPTSIALSNFDFLNIDPLERKYSVQTGFTQGRGSVSILGISRARDWPMSV